MKALIKWIGDGTPWVWLNATAVGACILLVTGLLLLIGVRGMGHFWPLAVHEIVYQQADGSELVLAGRIREAEKVTARRLRESGLEIPADTEYVTRYLVKTGNRDIMGQDFRWLLGPSIKSMGKPHSLVVFERQEWGVFIGGLIGVKRAGTLLENPDTWGDFQRLLAHANQLRDTIRDLEKGREGFADRRCPGGRLGCRDLPC